MISLPIHIWLVLAALAGALVTGVLAVLAHEVNHHIQRHNLILESRQRRYEYEQGRTVDVAEAGS
ncbi:MAG: hypothetical protein ACOCTI_05880 [Phycisphaeraceae bacterium]